jgi:hypothetical protein
MSKKNLQAFIDDKLSEFFDEEDERYQQRQLLKKKQAEQREKMRQQIRYYSFSGFGDEVMENMKGMIILILLLCGVFVFL